MQSAPGRGSGQFSFAGWVSDWHPVGLLQASASEDDDDVSEEEEASFSLRVVRADLAGSCLFAVAAGLSEACVAKSTLGFNIALERDLLSAMSI